MIQRTYGGSLSLATSRPGCLIRCVQAPSQQFLDLWSKFNTGRVWGFLPLVGSMYRVRANTHGPDSFPEVYRRGILLALPDGKAGKNKVVTPQALLEFEPYFPFSCFILIPAPAPVPARIAQRIGRR